MALRNIYIGLRYLNREQLLRTNYPVANFASHISSINNSRIVNRNHNDDLRPLSFRHNSLFIISRSLSVDSPRTGTEANHNSSASKIPPLEPEIAAKVVQEVQNSTLKSAKDVHRDNITKTIDTIESPKLELKPVVKVSLQQRIMNELIHYYHGFRLLFLDIKVMCGILGRVLSGHTLTRRERKQLVRTVADLLRVVPFAVFIVVPFMEFLLPFYIKFFPSMMPSTFKEKSKEAEKMHQLLKGKLEMAKFLQDTLDETINAGKYKSDGHISLETFNQFMKQAREAGNMANTDDILKFSRLFEDEVTLESLDHKQVKALCKLLDINSIGPKALLSFHLRMRVHQLKVDDKMIMIEGISKIPAYELQQLCRERGMRAIGVSEERLRFQLKQWLKLSIENQVPISLLLLSRTMYLPESLSAEEQLTKTILILPVLVSKEASLLTSSCTDKFDSKTMFEVIKEEALAIRIEKEAAESKKKETLVDKAPSIILPTVDIDLESTAVKTADDESISSSDLAHLETVIESMQGSQTSLQEEELEELKEEVAELNESAMNVAGADKLSKKLQHMIKDMDSLLDRLDVEKGALMKNVGIIGSGVDKPEINQEERVVAIRDLMNRLAQVESVSHNPAKWSRILAMLDEDHDGKIELHHVMEVIDLVEGEDIKLSSKEIERVLDAIDKEEVIEKEEEEGGGKHDGNTKT